MKGDAFETMVEKAWRKKLADAEPGSIVFFQHWDIERLLRRHHAKVRRAVEALKNDTPITHGYSMACDDILAALDRMAKGGAK